MSQPGGTHLIKRFPRYRTDGRSTLEGLEVAETAALSVAAAVEEEEPTVAVPAAAAAKAVATAAGPVALTA